MRVALLLLLGIWLHTASYAQQFFNKRLTLNSPTTVLTSVILKDGKYYCTGVCIDSTNYAPSSGLFYNAFGVKYAIFDSAGNTLKDTFYQEFPLRNLYAWDNDLCSMPNKDFVLAATNDIDSIHYHTLLLRFNADGNIVQRREYNEPYCNDSFLYNIRDIKPTGTGEWLTLASITCHQGSQYVQSILLTKLDSDFNILWEKEYGDMGQNYLPGKLLVDSDGYLLACGKNNFDLTGTGLYCQAYFIKTDTAGNKKWDWLSDPSMRTTQPAAVIRSLDGGYIYCGSGDGLEYSAGPGYDDIIFRAWIEKIDSNRHSVWRKSFNRPVYYSSFNKMIQLANGNLLVFGSKFIPEPVGSVTYSHTMGWLIKLDANGDSLDERTYSAVNSCNDENVIYDACKADDGSIIMVGESTDQCRTVVAPAQRGWIVKVDTNGCLGPNDPQCQPLNVNQPGAVNNVYVYPNPAHDVLHVRTGTIGGEMQAILSDVSGRELESKALGQNTLTNIETKGLPPGLYLLKVLQLDGAVKTYKVSHY